MPELAHPLQVALLGCGHPHSSSHLQTLCSLTEVTKIHLWDPEPAAADALAPNAGDKLGMVHHDLDDLLGNDDVTWLLVSVRNDLSPEVLLRCAKAGKPVLSEKPLGRGLSEVEPVVAAFRQAGLSLAVCFQNRYKPAALQLREWLSHDLLGRLCAGELRLHTTQVRLRNPKHWLFDQDLSGGGILPWLGCHYLDLLRFTTGLEVKSVMAHCSTLSGEEIDVEDMAALTMELSNGALVTGSFGYLMPGGKAGYLTPGYDTYFGLKGTLGQVAWEVSGTPQQLQVTSFDDHWVGSPRRTMGFEEEPAKAYGNRAGLEFARDCIRAAQRGGDGPTCGEDMLRVWELIEAAYRSMSEGVKVTL